MTSNSTLMHKTVKFAYTMFFVLVNTNTNVFNDLIMPVVGWSSFYVNKCRGRVLPNL